MRNIGKNYGAINVPIHNYERLPKREAPAGYVYVIQDMDVSKCYKIGRTNHPATRLIHQFGDLPFETKVVAIFKTNDDRALEKKLHQYYDAQKTRGEEWFKLDDRQVAEIKSMGKDTSRDTKAQAQRRTKSEMPPFAMNVSIHNYGRWPKLEAPAGYVYVIQDVDISKYYEIGCTNHPATRLNEFGDLPFETKVVAILRTPNASALKQALHQHYAAQRTRGEWFKLDARQVAEIKKHRHRHERRRKSASATKSQNRSPNKSLKPTRKGDQRRRQSRKHRHIHQVRETTNEAACKAKSRTKSKAEIDAAINGAIKDTRTNYYLASNIADEYIDEIRNKIKNASENAPVGLSIATLINGIKGERDDARKDTNDVAMTAIADIADLSICTITDAQQIGNGVNTRIAAIAKVSIKEIKEIDPSKNAHIGKIIDDIVQASKNSHTDKIKNAIMVSLINKIKDVSENAIQDVIKDERS